jgi:hypothetical protein
MIQRPQNISRLNQAENLVDVLPRKDAVFRIGGHKTAVILLTNFVVLRFRISGPQLARQRDERPGTVRDCCGHYLQEHHSFTEQLFIHA